MKFPTLCYQVSKALIIFTFFIDHFIIVLSFAYVSNPLIVRYINNS